MARLNELDLNLDNYSLNDLLTLFQLSTNFDKSELKVARKIVLKTHPDKSGLDKKYFLFLGRAYNILVKVLQFRETSESGDKREDYYKNQSVELSQEQKLILEKHSGTKGFAKLFNEMFDREFRNNVGGHGNWLKSNDDLYEERGELSKEEAMNAYKAKARSLIVHKGIEDGTSISSGSRLGEDDIQDFSSDVFAKCRFEDVRRAHSETVIGVTEDDMDRNRAQSVMSLRMARAQQNITPVNEREANRMLDKQNEYEQSLGTHRAFQLIKEDERAERINQNWWGKLKQLQN